MAVNAPAPGYAKRSTIEKDVPATATYAAPHRPINPGVWSTGMPSRTDRYRAAYGAAPTQVRFGDMPVRDLPDLSARPSLWDTAASILTAMPRGDLHTFSPWVGRQGHAAAGIRPRGRPQVHVPGIQQAVPAAQTAIQHIW